MKRKMKIITVVLSVLLTICQIPLSVTAKCNSKNENKSEQTEEKDKKKTDKKDTNKEETNNKKMNNKQTENKEMNNKQNDNKQSDKKSNCKKEEKISKNIVDIVVGDQRFTTLSTALKAADLVDTLRGEGPFTVFAPTNDAFAKLPDGAIEELLKEENKETLAKILKYHVVPKKLLSEDALKLDGKEIEMASGQKAKLQVKDDALYINDAKIIIKDVLAENGVIHVIDVVIMAE